MQTNGDTVFQRKYKTNIVDFSFISTHDVRRLTQLTSI